MRILAIEDEPELGRLLAGNLGHQGMAVDVARTLGDAQSLLATCAYDLILLDLRLPDGTGIDLLRRLRSERVDTPVIIVSATDAVADRITGLREGADDYVIKPFSLDELVARIGAVLRRPGRMLGVNLATGNLAFNTVSREVTIGGAPVTMPRRELAALEALMRADGRVVTRESLEGAVYALEDDRQSNVLESTISRLRRRLESDGATVGIRVVRGVGYRIGQAAEAAATGDAA
jgi:DNA-binding response OmpR family regulator